ncbi:MAG: hypothetical protein OEW16_08435 [Gammaproteobacteria bacterium]|nr:hypothetical protein [Gammaproteobacteria bacterium]
MDPGKSIGRLQDADGWRFLRLFVLVVASVALLVAIVNRIAYRQMLKPGNQTIVQLIDGWARVYKPILVDYFHPQVVVFGASWARDAFDPVTVGTMTGLRWFNHAVSGATPYETRRFIESTLDDPDLEVVVLNLDTILRSTIDVRMKYGFDEALLDNDPDGSPTRWLGARREYAITVSGAAIGNNLEVLKALRARDAGMDVSEYLESYDRFDFAGHEAELGRIRALLPELATMATAGAGPPLSQLPAPPYAEELDRILEVLCPRDIKIYAYFTPAMALNGHLGRGLAASLYGLDILRRYQPGCRAQLHFYNFNYANVVTLDGIAASGRYSELYRSDGHPRPTVGLLMAARMFGLPFPDGTPPGIAADFGADLLTIDDAEMRLRVEARQVEQLFAAVEPAGVQ